jgi:hypothetical protein
MIHVRSHQTPIAATHGWRCANQSKIRPLKLLKHRGRVRTACLHPSGRPSTRPTHIQCSSPPTTEIHRIDRPMAIRKRLAVSISSSPAGWRRDSRGICRANLSPRMNSAEIGNRHSFLVENEGKEHRRCVDKGAPNRVWERGLLYHTQPTRSKRLPLNGQSDLKK